MRESVSTERLAAHGINDVPKGWEVSKVKYLANYINGYAFKPKDWSASGKPIIRIQDLSNSDTTPNRFVGTLDSRYEVKEGDFLISWSASLGLYIWKGEDAWLNQHIFKVVLNENLLKRNFFSWLATWFMEELGRDTHGSTMQHLTKDAFGGFPVVLPPFETQTKIAHYLDRKTAEVDRMIGAKKGLLKLLDEKKCTLIARAVTRGLNPNAPLKDSGIPWLGMIPEHWEVERAKWLFKEVDERTTTGEEVLLSLRQKGGLVPHNDVSEKLIPAKELIGYKKVSAGEIVVNRMRAASGLIAISPQDGLVSPDYAVFQYSERVDPSFYECLFQTKRMQTVFRSLSKGLGTGESGFLRLYSESFLSIHLPLPQIEEQVQLLKEVSKKTVVLDELTREAEKTIALLQERRTALISAAVTGKLSEEMLNAG